MSQDGEWPTEEFGKVVILERGHNPPKSEFIYEPKKGYVRFWQIRDGWSDENAVYVPDTRKLHKAKKDDILMVAYRHIGRCFRGVEGAYNVALCKISNGDRDRLDDDFLFYMIGSEHIKGELLKRSQRSLIPSMSVKHLEKIQVPVPPKAEQKRIVSILDEAFSAIAKAKENAEKNLLSARELFESYLNRVFTQQGPGWQESTVGDQVTLQRGFDITKKQHCLLYTSPSPRDQRGSRMPSSA